MPLPPSLLLRRSVGMERGEVIDDRPVEDDRSTYRRFMEYWFGNIDAANSPGIPLRITDPVLAEQMVRGGSGPDMLAEGTIRDEKILRRRRNILARLVIAESTRLCGRYLELLSETDREGNLALGGAATILGGLGAVFTPAATVRSLSGLAGISSGLRSDFNSTFFYGPGSAVSQAINAVRSRELKPIIEKLEDSKKAYADYPYAAAYQEILEVHRQCSLSGAFTEIGKSLSQRFTEPLSFTQQIDNHIAAAKQLAVLRQARQPAPRTPTAPASPPSAAPRP